MVWDFGTYEILPDDKKGAAPEPAGAIESGFIRFRLHGRRLQGAWKLFRFRGERNWLLCKSGDDFVHHERDVLAEEPDSALTGRTMDEIAASGDVYEGGIS